MIYILNLLTKRHTAILSSELLQVRKRRICFKSLMYIYFIDFRKTKQNCFVECIIKFGLFLPFYFFSLFNSSLVERMDFIFWNILQVYKQRAAGKDRIDWNVLNKTLLKGPLKKLNKLTDKLSREWRIDWLAKLLTLVYNTESISNTVR